jgi:hypothetical protein
MPSHLSADHPAAPPPGRGAVEALISQTRRLKGEVHAVRRDTRGDGSDPRDRWQRALYDLALHQLQDLDEHLAQLRDGPSAVPAQGTLLSRVGSAEWNLLTDEAGWSDELYEILGRDRSAPPLSLDELPSLVLEEDRPLLTAMVTGCLVDARRIDGEFRIVRPDGAVRTVHMMGEPVLGADGGTASMWAVLRDVSKLRRSREAVSETRDSLTAPPRARTGHGSAVEPRETASSPWHDLLRLPHPGPKGLDLAAGRLPSATDAPDGDWYDALELPGGDTLLAVGGLTGHGATTDSGTAMLLGALRGMAMAGGRPGQLMARLGRLLDTAGRAVCCRYLPRTRTLVWAQAAGPAPLLFRDGTGRRLDAPDGVPLGAGPDAAYGEAEETLRTGDVLLLHTDAPSAGPQLLGLGPRLAEAHTAQDCLRTVVREWGGPERADGARVLVARVTS